VEFFNGVTSLGTPIAVTAGVATKAMTGVVAGTYSYTAKFIPTDATAFSPSTSSAATFVVTAVVPAPSTAKISWLSSTHGVVGSWVVIRGSGFGTAGAVSFGASNGRILYWSAKTIVVTVPATNVVPTGATPRPAWYRNGQPVPVTVTPKGGTASNAVTFTVMNRSQHHHH
jgi:hypothetical protein